MDKIKVLFICTHNSARSQMAEGLMRDIGGQDFLVYSAGTNPAGVNPYAVKALKEIGIDISNQYSKTIKEVENIGFGWVVTVCDHAKEVCPYLPGKNVIHKAFYDPGTCRGSDEQVLSEFCRIRDEIKDWIEKEFIPLIGERREKDVS